jgi:hypothetical protein
VARHVLFKVAGVFEGAAALGTHVDLAGVPVVDAVSWRIERRDKQTGKLFDCSSLTCRLV